MSKGSFEPRSFDVILTRSRLQLTIFPVKLHTKQPWQALLSLSGPETLYEAVHLSCDVIDFILQLQVARRNGFRAYCSGHYIPS